MKNVIKSFKSINYRLFAVLMITVLIPTLYQTVRIFFLGDMPADWGVNIASQLSWVNLLYEIIQEAIILPLFYLLGKSVISKDEIQNKVRTGLIISGSVYAFLSVIIVIFARPLCEFMAQDHNLIDATVDYIRLETIASTLSILVKFMTIVFVTLKKDKSMYSILLAQTILSVTLDTFLISGLSFSAKLGVNGIAISNIITAVIMIGLSIVLLKKERIDVFAKEKLSFSWAKEWGKIGLWSGLESFVRNLAFMIMIIKMVNIVSQSGNYWVANNFIWNWLLIPATALYDLIKKETAESTENIRNKTFGYLSLTTVLSLLWFASIPLWKIFLRYVMNVADYETVYHIVFIQSIFYVIYMFNCIFDGTIYGRGKTFYMLVQSICTNCVYYVFMFILYKTGVFVPTLTGISLMFGVGMAFDLLPTIGCYLYLLKKEKVAVRFNFSK